MSQTKLYKHLIGVNLFNINDKRKTKKNVKKKQKSRS